MRPWQVTHPTPCFTWMEWLKYVKCGSLLTLFQTMGRSEKKLSRTGASFGLLFQICEWQFMHRDVAGIPAKFDFSTDVWQ